MTKSRHFGATESRLIGHIDADVGWAVRKAAIASGVPHFSTVIDVLLKRPMISDLTCTWRDLFSILIQGFSHAGPRAVR